MLSQLRSSRTYQRVTRHEVIHQLIKYGLIGTLNVAAFLVLFNLFRLAGLAALPAYICAFVPTNVNSFFLNKRWAFRDERRHAVGRQYVGFAVLTVISLGINSGLFSLFLIALDDYGTIGENIAALAPLPVSIAWNFLSYRYWTFRRSYRARTAPAGEGSASA